MLLVLVSVNVLSPASSQIKQVISKYNSLVQNVSVRSKQKQSQLINNNNNIIIIIILIIIIIIIASFEEKLFRPDLEIFGEIFLVFVFLVFEI